MKTKFITVLLILSMLLSFAAPASAKSNVIEKETPITPNALMTYGAMLSSSGNGLVETVQILFNTRQQILYVVELERQVNGNWQFYETSYVGHETNSMSVYFTKTVYPPKGYCYRLKVNVSSSDFPNGITFYSNTLYY